MRASAARRLLDERVISLERLKSLGPCSPEMSRWFRETRLVLQSVFGHATPHCNTLDNIIVVPGVYTRATGGYDASDFALDLEGISSFLRALQAEITRNTTILGMHRPPRGSAETLTTDKITLSWLFKHVPMTLWFSFFGVLLAAFVAGIRAGQIPWIRDWFTKP